MATTPLLLAAVAPLSLLLLLSAVPAQRQQLDSPVSELCLACICEAISNCNRSLECPGPACGLFRITLGYWTDGGRNVVYQDSPDNPKAFQRCVTEPYCAARTIRGYMALFPDMDCNKDGVIDCDDFARIHRLGGYGDCGRPLDYEYESKYNSCKKQIEQISGGQPL